MHRNELQGPLPGAELAVARRARGFQQVPELSGRTLQRHTLSRPHRGIATEPFPVFLFL